MDLKELSRAKVVEAFLFPFNKTIKFRKIEEFERVTFIDGKEVSLGLGYTISGKIGGLEIEIPINSNEDCETYRLRVIKNK